MWRVSACVFRPVQGESERLISRMEASNSTSQKSPSRPVVVPTISRSYRNIVGYPLYPKYPNYIPIISSFFRVLQNLTWGKSNMGQYPHWNNHVRESGALLLKSDSVVGNHASPQLARSMHHAMSTLASLGSPMVVPRLLFSRKYPLVNWHSYGKSPFWMGKSTISMAIYHSFLYVYQRVNTFQTQKWLVVSTHVIVDHPIPTVVLHGRNMKQPAMLWFKLAVCNSEFPLPCWGYPLVMTNGLLLKMAIYSGFSH